MGSFDTKGAYITTQVDVSENVLVEIKGLIDAHNDIINYIIDSAKQMAALHTDINDTNILRTPSRRTSKRKNSCIQSGLTTTKKAQTSALKVRDVTTATPRRFSKRSKRSTIKLDITFEKVNDVIHSEPTLTQTNIERRESHLTIEGIIDTNGVEPMDVVIESHNIETKIENNQQINVNDVLTIDDKVMTASELMSELSIKEDETKDHNKSNESENEWMTDDEESQPKKETEEFYDAVDAKELRAKRIRNNVNNSFVNKTLTSSSAKEKRKKSLYFTPQTTQRSTRAQTRMLSRIADSEQKTPQTTSRCSRIKDSNITSSAETISSRVGGSSNRSVRSYSRIQKKTSDNKALTDSAMKKRQEAEEQRIQKLMASQEKEKRADEKRRILLLEKVNEKKLKSQEKANRAAEIRERQKQMETERLKKELEKREELERKRIEERRELLRKKQEETAKRAQEVERRKQIKEMQEMETKIKKQEELERKQELDRERLREQERLAAAIQHHNSSLQQKAVANSFFKKCESNTQLVPKVVITKMSPSETAQHINNTYKVTEEVTEPNNEVNLTFVKKKDSKEHSSYDMTPPPKQCDYDNYDISEIQSDDDTDDDEKPRKRIPGWARGHRFVEQVHNQYNKSQKTVFRDAKGVFGTGDQILNLFKDDFNRMFPEKTLYSKYTKRTSSAVWDEPPSRYRFDDSYLNQSSNQ